MSVFGSGLNNLLF